VSLKARITVAVALVLLVSGLIATFLPLSAHSSQQNQVRRQLTQYVTSAEQLASTPGTTPSVAASMSGAYVARLASNGQRDVVSTSLLMPHSSPKAPTIPSSSPADLSIQIVGSITGPGSWEATIVRSSGGTRLLVAIPAQFANGLDHTMGTVLLIARLLVLLVIVAAAWWILRLSLRPIAEVTRVAKAISSGDRSQRVLEPAQGTEAANLAHAFNAMIDQQQASEDRLRRFVGDASHELRTPVTAIGGFADLYRNGAVSAQEMEDVMRRIGQESARMKSLVEDMLLLARLDEGRPMERALVDVTSLATDAALDASASHPSRRVNVDGIPGLMVIGDDGALRQVFANLLTNALKYTSGVVEIALTAESSRVLIDVRDQGPGLGSEAVARAFDRFWRSPEARALPGAGLGLSIVHGIVTSHEGSVEMTSSDEGTHVRVSLPKARAHLDSATGGGAPSVGWRGSSQDASTVVQRPSYQMHSCPTVQRSRCLRRSWKIPINFRFRSRKVRAVDTVKGSG
jgi:two-component system OmpR family sensor kinase